MTTKATRNRQFPSKISTTQFVKLYILYLLSQKNYYGNALIEEIKGRMDYKWEPSPGMMYPLLRELESHNYIKGWWEEPNKRSVRHYQITDEGLVHYRNIKKIYRNAFEDSMIIIKNTLKDIYG